MEPGLGALPGFVFWRAAANSAAVKSLEIFTGVTVGVFQRSNTFFITIAIDLKSAPLYFPILRRCAAMALAGTVNKGKSGVSSPISEVVNNASCRFAGLWKVDVLNRL